MSSTNKQALLISNHAFRPPRIVRIAELAFLEGSESSGRATEFAAECLRASLLAL